MGAVGMWLGSADASIPRALPGAARHCSAEGQAAWAAMGGIAMLEWAVPIGPYKAGSEEGVSNITDQRGISL